MKKFIINVQEIQNNEYGDPVRSLLKSGVLTVESRWDALKVARNIAKRASRARVYSCEPVESYWRHGASKVIGFTVMREYTGVMPYEYVGITVTVKELAPAVDGIEWGEIE